MSNKTFAGLGKGVLVFGLDYLKITGLICHEATVVRELYRYPRYIRYLRQPAAYQGNVVKRLAELYLHNIFDPRQK